MFTNLKAQNFFSWENLDFDFTNGITLITGHNKDDGSSEGSGKSSVLNALSWCLYGQIPGKDIGIDEVIREGTKTCVVQTTLHSNHVIVRTRNSNELYIIEPDGKKIKGKDIKETQRKITLLLGMSFETFAQSVFFAQDYGNKFIKASQEEKVKVLSELQDLSWCDKAAKASYDKYKELSLEISKLEYVFKGKEDSKNLYKMQLKTFNEMNTKFEGEIALKVSNLKQKIVENTTSITQFATELTNMGIIQPIQTHKDRIATLESELTQLNTLVAHIAAIKSQYEVAKNAKNCPTCGQEVHKDIAEPVYPADSTEVFAAVSVRKTELDELRKTFSDLVEKDSKSKEIRFKINYLTSQNIDLELDLKKLDQTENSYASRITEMDAKLLHVEEEIGTIQQSTNDKYAQLESLKVLRDGFKELKSHVFKSLLTQLNHKANKYIQEFFDVPAAINFTNVSEDDEISKIITTVVIDGNERSLGALSGGQSSRVQIAVDFALSEIVADRTGNPMNIRILDEPFKGLSEIKMEKVIQLLEKMRGCTIIIEHNSMIKSIVNKVFNVTLVNGISYQS